MIGQGSPRGRLYFLDHRADGLGGYSEPSTCSTSAQAPSIMAESPSGRQFEIRRGGQRAVVTEVGATLRQYSSGDREVLDGFKSDEMCSAGRGQLLLPWPNRIRDGRYAFGGSERQLPLTEPERANAIHGLVRWNVWSPVEYGDDHVAMHNVLYPQPGYQFLLSMTVRYALSESGLTVSMSAVNVGAEACPFGAGAHPYITVGTDFVDGATLRLRARTRLESDDQAIPTGRADVTGTEYDFSEPRPIGALQLDSAFTDLDADEDGRIRAILAAPDGFSAAVWMDPVFSYVMVFTGDALGPPRARRSLALEPMTCPPNAFQSGEALRVLEPGERFEADWGITPNG
jgi:aldose 1-epimerase